MFPRLLKLLNRSSACASGPRFVEEVHLGDTLPPRDRRLEQLLLAGWIVIALKCAGVVWLVSHYQMPFSAWWVTGPTLVFGALCTALYLLRE